MPYRIEKREVTNPETIWLYHREPNPTAQETGRRIAELRAENPPFAQTLIGYGLVIGSTRTIGHIPPGYADMKPQYRSDLQLRQLLEFSVYFTEEPQEPASKARAASYGW